MKVINRIRANKIFGETIKEGKTIKNDVFVIHYKVNKEQHIRIGISVSTKLGHAVTRNRVKRQIRAMCDSSINYALHTFDIVIIVRQQFTLNTFQKNYECLIQLLSKIGITK